MDIAESRISKWNLFKLSKNVLYDQEKTIEFCKERNLLLKEKQCPTCMKFMAWTRQPDEVGLGYNWQCRNQKCAKKPIISARPNTWFENSKLSVKKSILITYLFASQMPLSKAVHESEIDDEQGIAEITDYFSYCREVCAESVLKKCSYKIGGPGLTVEIDVGKFDKLTNKEGHRASEVLVLGGICRETGDMFVIPVESREADTLIPGIISRVADGTTIVTNSRDAYDTLQDYGYIHMTVNHSENFVDPLSGAHVQTIENTWWQIKRRFPETYIQTDELAEHLIEFLWRLEVRKEGKDYFDALLEDISILYDGKTSQHSS